MGSEINKFGLKRYVSAQIREQIRKEAGFGCVICGCVLVDYEHIEPEWADAHEHNPDHMTLLCIDCHGRVTRRLISKRKVWEAKKAPKALSDGFVHDVLFVNSDEMEIKIGNSISKNTRTILTIHGKPIIWFEPPVLPNEPSKLCAIFYDDNGKPISFINRNQFLAFTDSGDIKSESTELSIIVSGKKRLLIDREGDKSLHIKRLDGSFLDTSVLLKNCGSLLIKQGKSSFTLGKFNIENCGTAFNLGDIPSIKKYNKIFIATRLANDTGDNKLLSYTGKQVGWIIGNEILNVEYLLVGYCKDRKVFNIIDEYIGNIVLNRIVFPDECYESGEPIYISNNNRASQIISKTGGYDVSFRLFGI